VVSQLVDSNIEWVRPESLKPYAGNPRTHSAKQIRQIADSIRTFGFTNPVLVDNDHGVIAGHGRIAAAKLLGIERVPTLRLAQMNEAEKRAYIIADNRLAENAGWDRELLAIEFKYLEELDLEFDLSVTGFDTGDIDLLLGDADLKPDAADEVPELKANPVSRPIHALRDIIAIVRGLLSGETIERSRAPEPSRA
jgi:ParB-like chromosome segregation protein Spo0J